MAKNQQQKKSATHFRETKREGVQGEAKPKLVLNEHSCASLNINWQLISPTPPSPVDYIFISLKKKRGRERENKVNYSPASGKSVPSQPLRLPPCFFSPPSSCPSPPSLCFFHFINIVLCLYLRFLPLIRL